MKIEFHCRECGGFMTSEDQFRGEIIRCPSCDGEVVVPLTTVGPGVVVAGFKILQKIGVGGMGSVYLAEQTSMGRKIALKVLPATFTRDQVFLDRFMKETRLQGSLSHPNIATAYDAGKYNDIYYLAMEYVEGSDLYEMIAQHNQIDERTALRIIRKAATGLAYAWTKQRLIHRDIKPSNIMIAPGEEVKILDLGVSKTLTQGGDTRHPTDEAVIGTPHYMSPEQARESSSVDIRSDMYSLGATLYHMVTGQTPFPGDNLVEVVTRQVSGPAPAPQTLNAWISEPCAHLLEVMMARDVSERYSKWDDCISDIGRVLSGHHPLASHPLVHGSMIEPSPLRRKAQMQDVKKVRSAVPVVAGLTVLLAAGLIWGVVASRPRIEPPSPPSATDPDPAVGTGSAASPSTASPDRQALEDRLALLNQQIKRGDRGPMLRVTLRTLADDAWQHGLGDIAEQARTHLAELRQEHAAATQSVLAELEARIQPLVDRGDLLEAAEILRSHEGPYAAATVRARLGRANALISRARERAGTHWAHFQEQVVQEIISSPSLDSVMPLFDRAGTDSSLKPVLYRVAAFEQELLAALRVPDEVMGTFNHELGQEVVVLLARGPTRLVIDNIGPHTVAGTVATPQGSLSYTFGFRDLAMQEKVGRLARSDTPAARFILGLLALEAGEPDHAIASFRRSGGDLSAALADTLVATHSDLDASNALE